MMDNNFDISEFTPYKFMTKEVFVQYKETLQRLKELHKELSVTHDKTIENELIQTDKIRFNLEKEYDWQDNHMLPALKEGKWGLVSQTEDGKELTSFKYDGIAFLGMFNGFEAMRNGEKIHLSISGEEDGESAVVINDFM